MVVGEQSTLDSLPLEFVNLPERFAKVWEMDNVSVSSSAYVFSSFCKSTTRTMPFRSWSPPKPSDHQVPIVPKATAKSKALAKAKAGPMPLIPTHVADADEEWELNTTMYQPGSMENPLANPDPNVAAMQDRLLHMENALLRVMQHLENQSQASQPEMEEAFS